MADEPAFESAARADPAMMIRMIGVESSIRLKAVRLRTAYHERAIDPGTRIGPLTAP